jgi:hypothetical protein
MKKLLAVLILFAASVSEAAFTPMYAVITSTIPSLTAYRKPGLVWYTGSTIALDTSTYSTANTAQLLFPDGVMRTEAQGGNFRMNATQTANWGNGTQQGGIRPTEVVNGANTWENFYAVVSTMTGNTTDFVLVGSTFTPIPANISSLNSFFGTNTWTYEGAWPYGDGSGATTTFPKCFMNGNMTSCWNAASSNGASMPGVRLATTAAATSLSWSYTSGTSIASGQVPPQLTIGTIACGNGTGTMNINDSGVATTPFLSSSNPGTNQIAYIADWPLVAGVRCANGGNNTSYDIFLRTWRDSSLGMGSNPQF